MRRGPIYARLSDVRKGDTEGIDRQIREGEAHAARLEVEIVEHLIDNDVTASKRAARPAFERLMQGIAANEWDVVILRSLDRWVRRPAELERIIDVVETSSVRIEAIHGEIDLRTRQGRLAARILTSVAMNEAEAITERVTDWHADRAARGLPLHGPAGYGFRRPAGTRDLEIDTEQAARIREAARRLLDGETLAAVARDYNDRQIPPPGTTWRPGTLRRILLAPRVAALRIHRGEIVGAAGWPAIVDRATFDAVTKLLTASSRRTKPADARARLLTGIAQCGKCLATLNAKPQNGIPRYYCRRCHGTLIAADHLDRLVAEMVFVAVDRPALADTLTRARTGRDTTTTTVDEILRLEADLAELAADLGEGRLTMAEWKPARAGIERRLAALRDELDQAHGDTTLSPWAGRGGALRASWEADDGLTVREKRAIVLAVFETLKIGPARPGVNRFDPDRVIPGWR